MGACKELMMNELEEVARLTGESEYDIHLQWQQAEKSGTGFNEFITGKSRKIPKKRTPAA